MKRHSRIVKRHTAAFRHGPVILKFFANSKDVHNAAKITIVISEYFIAADCTSFVLHRAITKSYEHLRNEARKNVHRCFSCPFRLSGTAVLRPSNALLGIFNGSQTDQLTRHLQRNKNNASRKPQMFSGQLIRTLFCCRRCGITTHVHASVKPSRRGFITLQFALRLRNRSSAE